MRGDQVVVNESAKAENLSNSKIENGNSSIHRVDINELLNRARQDEKKQKKENLVFFGLIASVIAITGIIASL
tara:strand:- start:116 stop:334 length:219 start_codon:yes stop_codon:yes gene_type:complete